MYHPKRSRRRSTNPKYTGVHEAEDISVDESATMTPASQIVAGVGVPHTPMFPALVAREGAQSETGQLFRAVADQQQAVTPEALIVFTSDHLNTFFLNNYPTLSIGVAEQTCGPND